MPKDNAGFIAEISVFDVQVGVTDPATLHSEQGFAMLQRAEGFLYHINLMIVSDDSSFHREPLQFIRCITSA
ncbi:hypothetical protein EPYR_02766 [Erwinia pyrifoliae DSM 12163]|nr:hypothetical protein EPYR_02766 [Erwinia pyrifoliae DSM 12163]